jgi:hypothetical protein
MNPTHAQNAQNPGNYSDEISIKKQYIEHVIDQSSMSTTARLYQSEIQDQTLESSGASNQFFHIQIKELQPGMNHCIDWCSFQNKRRNYSRVPSFSAGRKSCKASLNLLYIVCIACCVNGKKSTTQGKRIPSTQKPPDIITSGSIIQYFRKHINLLSAILRREFLESVCKAANNHCAGKQASKLTW